MARKEINVFGASFLDLLSGALGAVIILYVIVPKLTAEQSDLLDQVEGLETEITEITTILEQFRQSVPEEMYDELMARFEAMESQIQDLQQHVQEVTQELAESRAEADDLRSELEQTSQELEDALEQLEGENHSIAQLEDELQAAKEMLAQTFLVIYIQWPERGVDVDLHVTDPEGAEFYYARRTHPDRPGILTEDVTNGPGAEVWEVRVADAGSYLVEANLFSLPEGTRSSSVRGRIFYRDGSREIDQITLTEPSQKRTLLQFTVDSDGDVIFH
ncbi:MAG: hypothetical protein JJU46_12720 [Balneolaceae bacterium]|nr:hypothetical protein [Balneolaceae bacterium]MCH8549539.1 hypothetical protein [Balneolaceae bacterium]